MPGLDKTGPQGLGAMSGRQRGRCWQESPAQNNSNASNYGFGFGRGYGRGGRFRQHGWQTQSTPTDKSELLDTLNQLKQQLNAIEQQLKNKEE